MYQRIKALKGLAEVSKQPVFLMMTVNVFPYLEAFYQQEKIIPEAEAIKKDLFYMYSYLVCKQVTHRAKGGAMNEDHLLNSYAFNLHKILNYFRRVDELVRRAEIQNFIDNYRFLPLSSWITSLNEPSSPTTTSSLGFSSEEENACLARSPFSYRCSSSSFFSDENHPLQPRRRHSGQNVDRFEEEGYSLRSHTSSVESEEKKQFVRSRSRTQSPENSRRFFSRKNRDQAMCPVC